MKIKIEKKNHKFININNYNLELLILTLYKSNFKF